ncbi:50S ribosomal protein L25/general stress protein Ctc [Pelagibius marinus]|uniref:50S ribosomal protein L25/general stress protein Ctc n=1 Tax=Pelagibius marinus TaxID=2762760 RepID=UPI0018729CB1|nr:50S ribosomal protein L25/general stress protein Ctc [Pelagibius marinus]
MADVVDFPAASRERAGKGPARAARRAGQVPGVIYGAKKDPTLISVEERLLNKLLHQGGFFSTLFDVKMDGKSERVLARDVQFDPVTDFPVHIDFLRVSAATSVNVEVAVHFINEEECPGLKEGGVLNVVRHEIELACRADAIPSQIEIDLTGLQIGDGVHISMVKLPDGVVPTITDRDFTIATIAAPTVVRDEAAEEQEAAAEGEGEGEAEAAAEGTTAEEESKED